MRPALLALLVAGHALWPRALYTAREGIAARGLAYAEECAMRVMEKYVRLRDGNWYVGDSRVSVYSVISAWRRHRDRAPERIQQSYPSLPLVAISATIAYYLEYQAELDAFFDE